MSEEEISFPSKVRKSGNSLYILVPNEIAEFLELEPGDRVIVKVKKYKKSEKVS